MYCASCFLFFIIHHCLRFRSALPPPVRGCVSTPVLHHSPKWFVFSSLCVFVSLSVYFFVAVSECMSLACFWFTSPLVSCFWKPLLNFLIPQLCADLSNWLNISSNHKLTTAMHLRHSYSMSNWPERTHPSIFCTPGHSGTGVMTCITARATQVTRCWPERTGCMPGVIDNFFVFSLMRFWVSIWMKRLLWLQQAPSQIHFPVEPKTPCLTSALQHKVHSSPGQGASEEQMGC